MKINQTTSPITEESVRRVEVNETSLSYIKEGEGEPVVFIHGAASDYRIWAEQFNLFSRHYKAISYSRRYHQPNEWINDGSDYSRALHAADLIEFLKALKLKKAHIVGHSYGGAVALLAAVWEPELIGSLILAEASPFIDLLDAEGLLLLSKQKIGFDEAIRLVQNNKKEWALRQFLNVIVGADVLDQLPHAARLIVLENIETLEPMLKSYYESPPIRCEQLKGVNVPTLLVSGEFSPRISRLNNEKLDACLPDSEMAILQGASHGLFLENPEGFNRMALDFLSRR